MCPHRRSGQWSRYRRTGRAAALAQRTSEVEHGSRRTSRRPAISPTRTPPYVASGGVRRSTTKQRAPPCWRHSPPRVCSSVSLARTPGASAGDIRLRLDRSAEARGVSRIPRSRSERFMRFEPGVSAVSIVLEEPVENPKRHRLRQRAGIAERSDASRASVLAAALGDEPARPFEQWLVHTEQRLAEADAARVVVVHEDARGPVHLFPGIDGNTDVVPIAHQQQLGNLANRRCQTDDAVTAVVSGIRQCGHDVCGNRQPVRCRVHLLLGQVQLTRPDVLIGVELDLLETDDPRDHVNLTVRSRHEMGSGRLFRRIRLEKSVPGPCSNVSRIVTRVYVMASV